MRDYHVEFSRTSADIKANSDDEAIEFAQRLAEERGEVLEIVYRERKDSHRMEIIYECDYGTDEDE